MSWTYSKSLSSFIWPKTGQPLICWGMIFLHCDLIQFQSCTPSRRYVSLRWLPVTCTFPLIYTLKSAMLLTLFQISRGAVAKLHLKCKINAQSSIRVQFSYYRLSFLAPLSGKGFKFENWGTWSLQNYSYFALFKGNPNLLGNFLKDLPNDACHGLKCIK